ncbi:(2Fe-2S)-binding protein [bacterium]|nr:(2Fe-2S)-binding protein [bacterium]
MKTTIEITVNNSFMQLEIDSGMTLLALLRDELKIKTVHKGCGEGECGACTILLNGDPICSCLTLAVQADGARVETVEGLLKDGVPHPLVASFLNNNASQCGYCTPGVIMTAYALLEGAVDLSEEEIRKGIEGNLCRCTGYVNIVEAIKAAAKDKKEGRWW